MSRVALVRTDVHLKDAPTLSTANRIASISFLVDTTPDTQFLNVYVPVLEKVRKMLGSSVLVQVRDVTWELDYEKVKHKGIKV